MCLGTARGGRAVQLTFNEGETWLPLGGWALPMIYGSQIRSTTSSAIVELIDGSRIHVLPFNTVRFQEADGTIEVPLLHGRLTFQLRANTRIEILTPSARLEPVRQEAMVGEVFVDGEGVLGLKITRGVLHVQDLTDPGQVRLASLDPVFIPQRLPSQGPLFESDIPAAPPPGAKGIFTPNGERLGYLQPDGRLIVHPGFTADLTRPFLNKLVRMAMATIPEESRSDTTPLFNVNGKYPGYLSEIGFPPSD